MVLGIIRCHCRNVQVLSRRVRLCRADRMTSTSRNGIAKHLLGYVQRTTHQSSFTSFTTPKSSQMILLLQIKKGQDLLDLLVPTSTHPHIYRASEAVDMRSSSSGRPSNLNAYSQKHSSLASRNGATPHFHHVYHVEWDAVGRILRRLPTSTAMVSSASWVPGRAWIRALSSGAVEPGGNAELANAGSTSWKFIKCAKFKLCKTTKWARKTSCCGACEFQAALANKNCLLNPRVLICWT